MPISSEDRMAILELLARYNHAIDGLETETWLDCFTDDAVYEFPPDRRWEGIDELCKVGEGRASNSDQPASRHWLNNVLIEGDGETVQVICYLLLLRPLEGSRINHTGLYRHTVRKVGGAWKFSHRRMSPTATR